MWARVPETEGVSCGLGDAVSDRMCREPFLRSLPPADLARRLGVTVQDAQAGILRLAEAATGRKVIGVRGQSFDEVIGAKGRAAPRVSIEYAPDAQGGFATPAAPGLLEPGSTDPRTRSFTRAILDPNLVAQYGADAVRALGYAGLVPPPEDLDRVAIFTPPPIDWPGQWFGWLERPQLEGRDPRWSDVQTAGSAIGRPDLDGLAVKAALAWWRQAYALGPLPEDEQGIDQPGSPSFDWPRKGTANVYRKIYFWGFGKDGKLYQHMQLQKSSFDTTVFRIFNQYGQNLTFVRQPDGRWLAGWDFGDWFTQNKRSIVSGLQLAVTAVVACIPFAGAAIGAVASTLFGVTQFGLSLGLTTAISGAVAAQQAFIAGMMAISKGDIGEAFRHFTDMAKDLDSVPITGDAHLIPPAFNDFVQNAGVKALASVVGSAGTGDVGVLVTKAAELGQGALRVTAKEIDEARALVPDHLRPWFDQAVREGGAALARKAPWYAEGVHTLGLVLGTLKNPASAGVRAPRAIPAPVDLETKTLAELEAMLATSKANYERVRFTPYALSHPDFLAAYEKNIAALEVRIAVKKNPNVLAQPGAALSWRQALAISQKSGGVAPSAMVQTSPVPVAVGGGLLALLFFL